MKYFVTTIRWSQTEWEKVIIQANSEGDATAKLNHRFIDAVYIGKPILVRLVK